MANEQNNFENDEVSSLLGTLKRMDAPGDFDFHVRTRIAAGRPSASWLPFPARVAVPLLLVAAIGGYFGVTSLRSPAVKEASIASVPVNPPAVLEARHESTNSEPVLPTNSQTNDSIALLPPGGDKGVEKEKAPGAFQPKTPATKRGGGSVVETQRIANVLSLHRLPTKKILSDIGVDANFSGSAWTVGEVKQNSVAERSGLKSGDLIEAVNGKKVRVRRDGKIVQIDLKP